MNLPVSDGRLCPLDYQYTPQAIAATRPAAAETLYVIGGLYGNIQALDQIEHMAAAETGNVQLVFNGDFNWFNRDAASFAAINRRVLQHAALRGNVETEIARPDFAGGCGCGYPDSVSDQTVDWSNQIIAVLRTTADAEPAICQQLRALPQFCRYQVGDASVAVIHGDLRSLAGWAMARENMTAALSRSMQRDMAACGADIIASTHTCEAAAQIHTIDGRALATINNGAAGMPNFHALPRGLITRISTRACRQSLYGGVVAGVHVDAVEVAYDHARFTRDFERHWPAGSAAYQSYFSRISHGPALTIEQAIGTGFTASTAGPDRLPAIQATVAAPDTYNAPRRRQG